MAPYTRARLLASWQQTGADAVVDAGNAALPVSPSVQRQIAAVPGVVRTATVLVTSGSTSQGSVLTVAFVRPAQFAAGLAETRAPPFGVAALTSARQGQVEAADARRCPQWSTPAAIGLLGHRPQTVFMASIDAPVTIRITGVVSSVPAISDISAGPLLILPVSAAGASGQPPNLMLIAGPNVDAGRLTHLVQRTLPGSSVLIRSRVLAALTTAPISHGGYLAFAAASFVAAGFMLLILVITLVLGARSRRLTLGPDGRYGTAASAKQVDLGSGGAAADPRRSSRRDRMRAGAGSDSRASARVMSVFTGAAGAIKVQPEPQVLAVVAGGLVLLAMITLAIQAAITSREGSARALRIGE